MTPGFLAEDLGSICSSPTDTYGMAGLGRNFELITISTVFSWLSFGMLFVIHQSISLTHSSTDDLAWARDPFAALTGTADADTCSIVISTLCLKDPLMVHISPNRNNLCFAIIVSTRKDAMFAELDWLVHHIKEKGHGQLTTKQLYFATP